MRQAGVVAAAALYALDHNVDRLADDHARARRLAEGLAEAGIPVDLDAVETNFVGIPVPAGMDVPEARARIRDEGVLVSGMRPGVLRAATYLGIEDEHIDHALDAIPRALGALSAPESLLAELRRELIRFQRESPAPSATAALFRGDELLWTESVGLADVETGRAATPDSQYAIALDHEDASSRARS